MTSIVRLNRRRYAGHWQRIENMQAGDTIEIAGQGPRAEANRVRTALQSMAKYRGIALLTSITMLEDSWRLTIVRM